MKNWYQKNYQPFSLKISFMDFEVELEGYAVQIEMHFSSILSLELE